MWYPTRLGASLSQSYPHPLWLLALPHTNISGFHKSTSDHVSTYHASAQGSYHYRLLRATDQLSGRPANHLGRGSATILHTLGEEDPFDHQNDGDCRHDEAHDAEIPLSFLRVVDLKGVEQAHVGLSCLDNVT